MRALSIVIGLASVLLAGCDPPQPLASTTGEQAGMGDPASHRLADAPRAVAGPPVPEAAIATLAALFVPEDRALGYFARAVDLDGDGHDEVVAEVVGDAVCTSAGCSVFVLSPDKDGVYRLVAQISPADAPVLAAGQRHGGWRDLLVTTGAGLAQLGYDGRRYPDNPDSAAAALLRAPPDDAELLLPAYRSAAEAAVLPVAPAR